LRQPADKPIPVEVKQPDPGALTTLAAIIAPLLSPLPTTGIVVIFVVFILLQRQDLRNRFVRLAGSQNIQRTTAALDEAGERLSKLFLTQIAFNAAFGLAIGIGLELIGVPSAPLWGLIAMIMRFVPYIGAVISAVFALILAAAVQLVYQRLLAGDPIEAAERARAFLKHAPLEDYYDAILLNGLRLAAADSRLGHLDDERLERILATVSELTNDLDAHDDV
jgi:AI-2E family transporter